VWLDDSGNHIWFLLWLLLLLLPLLLLRLLLVRLLLKPIQCVLLSLLALVGQTLLLLWLWMLKSRQA